MMFRHGIVCGEAMKKLGQFFILLTFSVVGFANDESADEGKRLYEAACTPCHGLAPIERTRDGRAGWEDTVQKMVVIGTQLNADEMELVIDYLYKRYGPDGSDPMRTGVLPVDSPLQGDGLISSENVVLPEGEGKQLVHGFCTMCHDLGYVVATRRGPEAWQRYTTNMLRQNGISLPGDEQELMVTYLNRHFGKVDPR
jgi:cytochrome c5